MIHTDRGFQYTGNGFHKIVEKAGLVHSMSRVGCCADNGLMEGFRGMLKRERKKKTAHLEPSLHLLTTLILHYHNMH